MLTGALVTQQNITQNQTTDYLSVAGQTLVRVKNGVESYPINDHLGSAYRVADRNGSVAASQRFNYTPFGETLGAGPGANTEQGFTGHVEDKTGLVYMQARFYDPAIGRFLQTDPIGYEDQMNLYAYVHNNPVSLYDPFGLRSNCRPMDDTVGTSCSYIDQASTTTSEQVDNESAQKGIVNESLRDNIRRDGNGNLVLDLTVGAEAGQEAQRDRMMSSINGEWKGKGGCNFLGFRCSQVERLTVNATAVDGVGDITVYSRATMAEVTGNPAFSRASFCRSACAITGGNAVHIGSMSIPRGAYLHEVFHNFGVRHSSGLMHRNGGSLTAGNVRTLANIYGL